MTLLYKKAYINGELISGRETKEVFNPATGDPIGSVAWLDSGDTKKTLQAAEDAFWGWSKLSVSERVSWMHKIRDEVIKNEEHLRECVQLETGKKWDETAEDFNSLVNSLKYYGEIIKRFQDEQLDDSELEYSHRLVHEPVGVAVAFIAWNFPLLNLAFKIGPAMAAGCPIIIKPSGKTPLAAYAVGELCAKINLPKGVVNIVCGDNQSVGDILSSSTTPALLTLIGSISTGRHIMNKGSTSIKRYSMELGGNAPAIICDDADLDLAAEIVCNLKLANAGQICVTPNRVLVAKSIKQEFTKKLLERVKSKKPSQEKNEGMGPVIDVAARDRIHQLVVTAQQEGAKLLFGGDIPADLENGSFYMPTVLSEVKQGTTIYNEEIFGPVISLVDFETDDEALNLANDTDTGLTAYVFTKDTAKAQIFAKNLRFGEIQINGVRYNIDLPHIGMKQSGIGCDCSHLALNDYLTIKRISQPQ